MISSRGRPILGFLSVILFAVSTYIALTISPYARPSSPLVLNLMVNIIAALNLPILFAWIAFGASSGVTVTLLAIVLVFFVDLRAEYYGYNILILPFFLTASIGYGFSRVKHRMDQLCSIRSEKLEEAVNVLSNDIKEKKKSMTSLEEKMARYSLLKDVAECLSTALSLDDIDHHIIDKTARTIGKGGRILLFLVDPEKQELMLSASRDESTVMTKKGDAFDHWVLRHRKNLYIEDATNDFRFPAGDVEAAKETFRSLIAAPMMVEDKVIGILRMDSPADFMYSQDDLRLLDIIASLGAVAIQNALLYSRTQELAVRDGLTGLYVRRFFMEGFHQEINRAARKKENLALLMLDIDRFKHYNDRHGHAAGDLILRHLARTVQAVIEEGDIVGRYGGEEIVLLLCGKGKEAAVAIAEKIRAMIKEKPLTLRRQEANVTVSVGVATYPEDAVSEEELIRVADERLYKAKTQGRDKVCSA